MKRIVCRVARLLVMGVVAGGALAGGSMETRQDGEVRWAAADIKKVDGDREEAGRSFLEFIRVPDLSAGLYVLGVGAEDRQQPHDEDEIYYVLEGRGVFSADGETTRVEPGSVLYVKAHVEHRFHSIEEELKILVVFAPAFGSRKGSEGGQ